MNAKKAAYVAGFRTSMMLDYLERQGLFEREEVRASKRGGERRRGRRRDYTFRDVVILRSIAQLLEHGVSVERIKKAVISLSRDDKFQCERSSVRYGQDVIQYLATDGKQIYFKRDRAGVTSLLQGGQGAFLFVLDITQSKEFVVKRDPELSRRSTKVA